jgi:hypothetical protein
MKEYQEKGHSVAQILSDVDQSMQVCVLILLCNDLKLCLFMHWSMKEVWVTIYCHGIL